MSRTYTKEQRRSHKEFRDLKRNKRSISLWDYDDVANQKDRSYARPKWKRGQEPSQAN